MVRTIINNYIHWETFIFNDRLLSFYDKKSMFNEVKMKKKY